MTGEFRTSVRIAATPEQVFPYLVEPDQLVRWMIFLTPDGPDTIVDLTHRGLDADQQRDHRVGWLHWLERLAIASAGGDPGPDTPPTRPSAANPPP